MAAISISARSVARSSAVLSGGSSGHSLAAALVANSTVYAAFQGLPAAVVATSACVARLIRFRSSFSTAQSIPAAAPLVDPNSGMVSVVWLQWLLGLSNRP